MDLKPIIPFEPITMEHLPHGMEWIAQIKWDGVRMLTYYDGKDVRLVNRRLNDRTSQYPELTQIASYCSADSVILDGEIIALVDGKPSFHEVMRRDGVRTEHSLETARRQVPVSYMLFDVLYVNGEWVTNKPLRERQRLLSSIITPSGLVQIVPSYPNPEELFHVVRQHKLEGIVCKDVNSTYVLDGKDKRWGKKKIFHDLIAAVGGVTYRDKTVNSLLLGLYDPEGRFIYIGHAGTGRLKADDWRRFTETAAKLRIPQRPFVNQPERHKDAIWVDPKLAVKIRYLEWTPGGTLRHPSIQAFVDLPARDCVFGQS